MLILDLIIIIALIRVNIEMETPMPCTVIYSVIALVFAFIMHPWWVALIAGAVTFGLAYLFFWLLIKTKNSGAWWAVAVIGVLFFTFA